jgi:hypothetical protein
VFGFKSDSSPQDTAEIAIPAVSAATEVGD